MLKDISTKENNAVYSTYVLSLYNLFILIYISQSENLMYPPTWDNLVKLEDMINVKSYMIDRKITFVLEVALITNSTYSNKILANKSLRKIISAHKKTGAPYPETTCIEELMTFKENPSNCDQNTVIIEERSYTENMSSERIPSIKLLELQSTVNSKKNQNPVNLQGMELSDR
ncbi:unnamed protein product [Pieris macdunnoughi]|uniref:Uncharacterized protein n=1 Tax=Pieris macdunnoughi TaxID=345717 RepID=A0A821T9A0_9NEOP|nr:unnamed protein product [Pieris macdunnoughi]